MADGERRGFFEWFTRRHSLRDAREQLKELPRRQLELERRARLCRELADRVLDPVEPLRDGAGTTLAIDLYRQACYWASAANEREEPAPDAAFWDRVLARLPDAGSDTEARAEVRGLLVDGSFQRFADMPEADQRAAASRIRDLAHALIALHRAPRERVNRLLRQRLVRLGLTASTLIVLGSGIAFGIGAFTRDLNLAQGKPWKTSSVYPCQLQKRECDGMKTTIFFHTREDEKPWIEYDLGKPTPFSSVFVRNRTDAVPDRALPLILESSKDGKRWSEIARQSESFRTWKPEFRTRTARYVRLRVGKKSFFHLEAVEIYP